MEYWYIYVIKLITPSASKKAGKRYAPFKIWKTKKPEQRLYDIQRSLPYDTDVIMLEWLDNYSEFEKILHENFNKQRIKWERFNLSACDVWILKILYDEFKKDNILCIKELHDSKLQSQEISQNVKLVKCLNCRKKIKSYISAKRDRKFCDKICFNNYNKLWTNLQ
jgi:hypothetical protein